MADLPAPPPIDYTSRDFASIRDDLLALIPAFMPEWTNQSPNDFGVVLLELFAYVGDILNYYADRNANEAFLSTASQRASVIRLARLLGYTPSLASAASTNLTFTNSSASPVTIPAGTKVSTSLDNVNGAAPVTFETDSDLTVSATSSASVSAHEGVTISNEQVGVSDGSVDQTFPLFNPDVIQGSVAVTVNDGTSRAWSYSPHLIVNGPFDQVFSLLLDENDITSVVFGDSANGEIPSVGAVITATYRVGGGASGNVAANTLVNIVDNVPAGITVTNSGSAIGGAPTESTASIRTNAVRAVNSQGRAVTLDDFASVAVQVPSVGKASAVSATNSSVTVYVAPDGGGGVDGSGVPQAPLASLITSVAAALADAAPAPTTVTVLGPTYVPINITVTVHVANAFRQDRVVTDTTYALSNLLDFDNVIFGDTVTVADIQAVLLSVPGASWGDITLLDRDSGSAFNNSVALAANEIPVVGTITVNGTGGIS